MSTVTLKDIAKALNISVSSVSRALHDSYEISEETKARVLNYAKSVKYKPNPVALSLKENKSHSICVIVPEISNNFFADVINGIESVAIHNGYHVMIFQTHEQYELEMANIEHGISRRVDGVIISLSGKTVDFKHLDIFESENIPVVYIDRVPTGDNYNKVVVDNFEGAQKGTAYLISKGMKRIAHITSPLLLSISKERLNGYKKALEENGIPFSEDLVKHCSFSKDDVKKAIEEVVISQKPDSFFLGSDRLTLQALEIIKEIYKKPIEIVGFTNISAANLLNPALTTITQPAFEMGEKAAQMLINSIEKKQKGFQQLELNTFLEVREPR